MQLYYCYNTNFYLLIPSKLKSSSLVRLSVKQSILVYFITFVHQAMYMGSSRDVRLTLYRVRVGVIWEKVPKKWLLSPSQACVVAVKAARKAVLLVRCRPFLVLPCTLRIVAQCIVTLDYFTAVCIVAKLVVSLSKTEKLYSFKYYKTG